MHRFEIKKHDFNENNLVNTYISCSTSIINPLEVEKDVNDFIDFIQSKYKTRTIKEITFKGWLQEKVLGKKI